MSHDPIWDVIRSTSTPGSVANEVGSITLNSDGTISVSGSYTSDLNSDQTAAINGGGFTKVFAGGYGMYAAQRSNGSLLVLGYLTNDSEEQSTVQQLLSSNISDVRFNYGAGAAKTTSGSIITWGHDGYENQVHNLFGEYTISPSATSINEGSTLTTSVSTNFLATNTTLYYSLSGIGINSSDFSSGSLTGSGTVDSNGDFSFSHTLANDVSTESSETLNIKLFSDSALSTQVGTTSSITITDTSLTRINEGDSVFSIRGEVATGKTLNIVETLTDPDNAGTYSYSWKTSTNGSSWIEVSKASSYTINTSDAGKQLKATITYQDGDGFSSIVTAKADVNSTSNTEIDKALTASIPFGETSSSSFNNIDIALNGDITLGTFFDDHLNLKSDLNNVSNKYGTSNYNFDIWLNQGGKISIRRYNDSEGNWRVSSHEITNGLPPEYMSKNNEQFLEVYKILKEWSYKLVSIPEPSYTISPSATSINEGDTLTTSISTTNVAANTTLYYSLSGTGITSADFSSGALTGSGTVNSNGDFSFAHTLANDVSTESSETLNIKLFSDSALSTQVGTTTVVTIADTSKTPTYTISPSATSINEGSTLTTSISTTNVAANTTLYYSLSGTGITSADFSSGALTGSGTIDSDGDFSFAHTLAEDLLNEGDETLEIKLFSDSNLTTQVGATKSVTITGGSTIYDLSVDNPSVIEADTNTKTLTYTLTLDQATTEKTNINYETLTTGTATSGEDFVKAAGVVTFSEGQKVATLNITINGDLLLEEDETVKVKFSSSKLKEDVISTGTITNNDIATSSYSASVDSPSITETDTGTKTLAYTITLDQEASEVTTINYQTLTTGSATTGEDFVTAAGVITFAKGQKVATLNISVNGDADVENDETIQVKFSGTALNSEVIATGTIKNNDITGTAANDTLNGTTDNDNLQGGGGADVIDGGAGTDTASYSGKFNDYTITKTTTTIQITDIRVTSPDGVDTIQNIEYVQFTDQLVATDKVNVVKTFSGKFMDYKFYNKGDGSYEIKSSTGSIDVITGIPKLTFADKTGDESVSAIADIKGVFDLVTGLNTGSGEMFRLYNAAFARFPDASGLQYWIDKYTSGVDDSRAVSQSFLLSAEFKERYGDNISHETYVENLYLNVLNRELDQEGYDYWVGNLNNGIEQRHEVLLGFAESAENKTLFTEMTGLG